MQTHERNSVGIQKSYGDVLVSMKDVAMTVFLGHGNGDDNVYCAQR